MKEYIDPFSGKSEKNGQLPWFCLKMLFKIIIREGCEYRRIMIQYVYKEWR